MVQSTGEMILQRNKALEYENWEDFFKKFEGYSDPGGKVEIQWTDRDISDFGYVFTLPDMGMDLDENDFFIHIPRPENLGGIGDAPEVHIHSYELASFDLVKKIICSRNL